MKIILTPKPREIVEPFTCTEDLISLIKDMDYSEDVVRVELTSEEFKVMLSDVDLYNPVGIRSSSREDYSGCFVRVGNRWCVQTHHSYFE